MRPILRLLVVAFVPSLAFAAGDEVPFQRYADAYLQAHGAKTVADLPVEKLLAQHYVHGAFGVFDVAYPASFLSDKPKLEEFQKQCTAIVLLQEKWIEWLAPGDARCATGLQAAKTLETWIKAWKPAALAKAATNEKLRDLYAIEGAEAAETGAQKALDELLNNAEILGVAPKDVKRLTIVFAPTRRDFVEMLGYGGLVDASQQSTLWQSAATSWTSFWIGWNFVLALEYPAWGNDPEFRTGMTMNKFEPTGSQEHTMQNAANALQWMCYGEDDATYMHQAIAMNLTIAAMGEANALEGDVVRGTTGAATQPYEKFVPGGNPAGGILPPIPAAPGDMLKDGHWRKGKGKDHFASILREGQRDGLKQVAKDHPTGGDATVQALLKDKDAHFLLSAGDGGKKAAVSAPFLGKAAFEKPYPPQEVILDYKEFFRAYKSCFFDWLQNNGDKGGSEPSRVKFRELMKKVVTLEPGAGGFEKLVGEHYGVPLSAKNGETDSLEWRFLAWLSKQK